MLITKRDIRLWEYREPRVLENIYSSLSINTRLINMHNKVNSQAQVSKINRDGREFSSYQDCQMTCPIIVKRHCYEPELAIIKNRLVNRDKNLKPIGKMCRLIKHGISIINCLVLYQKSKDKIPALLYKKKYGTSHLGTQYLIGYEHIGPVYTINITNLGQGFGWAYKIFYTNPDQHAGKNIIATSEFLFKHTNYITKNHFNYVGRGRSLDDIKSLCDKILELIKLAENPQYKWIMEGIENGMVHFNEIRDKYYK
jgi:hypothetical protein